MTAQPLRFRADLQSFTVTDSETGEVYQCSELFETATLRRNLELKHRPAVVTSAKKAQRQREIAERRQGGQR